MSLSKTEIVVSFIRERFEAELTEGARLYVYLFEQQLSIFPNMMSYVN